MNPERWRQVEHLYHSALEQPPSLRLGFLAQACGGDQELQHNIEVLLGGSLSSFLDRPAWESAPDLLDETAQFENGSQLGPYRLLGKIGKGGMATVYRAQDSRLGRDVAIKIVSAQFSARVEREARAIAALNHPHICTLHDVGPDYLVMELCEGETLAARMTRGMLPQ